MLKDKLSKGAKRGQINKLSNKGGRPRKTNVGLGCPWFHEFGVWTTHKPMHEHVGKRAKMQKEPNRWHKASKASMSTLHGVEKGVYQAH